MRVWSYCLKIWSVIFASFVVEADAFGSRSVYSRERQDLDLAQLFVDPLHLMKHFFVSYDHLQNRRIVTTNHGYCWRALGICSFCPSCLCAVLFLESSLFLGSCNSRPTGCFSSVILRYFSVIFQSDSFLFPCGLKGNECGCVSKRDNQLMFSLSLAMVAGSNLDPDCSRFCYVCRLRWWFDSGFWLIFLIRALLVFCSRTLITLGLRFSLQLLTIRMTSSRRRSSFGLAGVFSSFFRFFKDLCSNFYHFALFCFVGLLWLCFLSCFSGFFFYHRLQNTKI